MLSVAKPLGFVTTASETLLHPTGPQSTQPWGSHCSHFENLHLWIVSPGKLCQHRVPPAAAVPSSHSSQALDVCLGTLNPFWGI